MSEPTVTEIMRITVPTDLADEFRARAKRGDRPVAAEVRRALRLYLDTVPAEGAA